MKNYNNYINEHNLTEREANLILSPMVKMNMFEEIEELIEKGVNINSLSEGNSNLLLQVKTVEMLNFLIDKGIDINHINDLNNTPIMYFALQYKYITDTIKKEEMKQIIEGLIDNGANLNSKNTLGKDFFEYIDDDLRNKLIKKFPKQYKDYLLKKDLDKFNI